MGVHGACLDLDLVAPYPAEQLAAAHHLTGTGGEQGEEVELGQREHHLLTIAKHLAASEVDDQSGKLEAIAGLLLRG